MTLAPGSVARLVAAILAAGAALFAQHGTAPRPSTTKPLEVDLRGRIDGIPDGKTARVTLLQDYGRRGQVLPLTETIAGSDGAFAFESVPWPEGHEWGFNKVLLLARCGDLVGLREYRGDRFALDRLRVALKPGIDLRGELRDRDTDVPIAGARVWPSILGPEFKVWLTAPLSPWVAWTDEKGRFVLRGVPDLQPIKLRAGADHHATTWIDVEDVTEPVVASLPPGGAIAGVVRMPDGSPAPDVRVTATGMGGAGYAVTDAQGRFRITALKPESYKVFATAPDLTVIAVTGVRVAPGEDNDGHTVQLVKGGFIVGKVVDAATGKPIPTKWYTDVAMYGPARGSGGSCECAPVRKDGTFRIRAPEGRNRIYLRGTDGYSEPTEWVDVVEGEETEVVWRVKKGR